MFNSLSLKNLLYKLKSAINASYTLQMLLKVSELKCDRWLEINLQYRFHHDLVLITFYVYVT